MQRMLVFYDFPIMVDARYQEEHYLQCKLGVLGVLICNFLNY